MTVSANVSPGFETSVTKTAEFSASPFTFPEIVNFDADATASCARVNNGNANNTPEKNIPAAIK
jgi:hypothetical protein